MPVAAMPLPPLALAPFETTIDLTLPTVALVGTSSPAVSRQLNGARALACDADFWKHREEIVRLGRGCFGSVLLMRERASGHTAAVKVVASVPREHEECPLREPELLRAACHRHIVRLLEVYQSPTTLFLVQEAARTDLLAHAAAQPDGLLSEHETRGHLAGLLSAVQHIHSLNIVHRDIKATNVLLSDDGQVRLADFGLAVQLPEEGLLTSVCGTHDYLAPEMIRCGHGEAEGYGTPVDLWGVGLLMYALLFGGNPFERDTDIATLQAILNGEFAFPHEAAPSVAARDLIRRLLKADPALRISAKVASHEVWCLGV